MEVMPIKEMEMVIKISSKRNSKNLTILLRFSKIMEGKITITSKIKISNKILIKIIKILIRINNKEIKTSFRIKTSNFPKMRIITEENNST